LSLIFSLRAAISSCRADFGFSMLFATRSDYRWMFLAGAGAATLYILSLSYCSSTVASCSTEATVGSCSTDATVGILRKRFSAGWVSKSSSTNSLVWVSKCYASGGNSFFTDLSSLALFFLALSINYCKDLRFSCDCVFLRRWMRSEALLIFAGA
jgi:hypothetical protein